MEEYDTLVKEIPGLYSYPYIAKITGSHEKYVFERSFLHKERTGGGWYTFEMPGTGVYEECVIRKDRSTGEVVQRERIWYVYHEGDIYEIERKDVLDAVADPMAIIEREKEEWERIWPKLREEFLRSREQKNKEVS